MANKEKAGTNHKTWLDLKRDTIEDLEEARRAFIGIRKGLAQCPGGLSSEDNFIIGCRINGLAADIKFVEKLWRHAMENKEIADALKRMDYYELAKLTMEEKESE